MWGVECEHNKGGGGTCLVCGRTRKCGERQVWGVECEHNKGGGGTCLVCGRARKCGERQVCGVWSVSTIRGEGAHV